MEGYIVACGRVPSQGTGKSNIIVQFESHAMRDIILNKAKRGRLTNNGVGLTTGSTIYVNEHLCRALKNLLTVAVKKKYEYKWKCIWSLNEKIYAKQTNDTSAVCVLNERAIESYS